MAIRKLLHPTSDRRDNEVSSRHRMPWGVRMEREEEGAFGVVPGEDVPDRPRVVDEAYEVAFCTSSRSLGSHVSPARF